MVQNLILVEQLEQLEQHFYYIHPRMRADVYIQTAVPTVPLFHYIPSKKTIQGHSFMIQASI